MTSNAQVFTLKQSAICLCFATTFAAVCLAASTVNWDEGDDAELLKQAQSLFPPLPKDMATSEFPTTTSRVRLGQMLFFDPRMSGDGTVSCARCHLPGLYATDSLTKSIGAFAFAAPRNAPTVFYTAMHSSIHWDGQFATVEEQAKKALLGPAFGNENAAAARARLKSISGYAAGFQEAFPGEADPITEDNWGKAIGAYERTLVSPSRFDEFLAGKPNALTPAERMGLRTFIETGCADCHKGRGVGGAGFRKFGMFSDYRKATGSQGDDKGRFGVTKDAADVDKFKVPGLRDVTVTPPYFHDGSVDTLPKAVRIMAKIQLDVDLSDADVASIVDFLGSLTAPLPEGFDKPPVLPSGGFVPPPSKSRH
jgi:cytochrome c peroxidase